MKPLPLPRPLVTAPALAMPALAGLAAMLSLAAIPALAKEATRPDVRVSAKELAAPSLLAGPLHTVADPVAVEGHLGRFVIESRFGVFTVHGANLLAVRVHELRAIEELGKVRKDAAFAAALAKSAGGVASFAAGAVDDPKRAAETVGKGAVSVLGRVGQVAKTGASYAVDKASDAVSSPPAGAAPATGEEPPSAFVGDPLGYNKARREWAKKLGIDPYTTNPVLKPLLDEAAAATFAGNFAVGLTLGAVVAPVQYAYSFDETVRDSVWNTPAIDLRKATEDKLLALGVDGRAVRDFQRNRWFSPTMQRAMAERLAAIGRIEGLTAVVRTAATVEGEARVRFLVESLALLAAGQAKDRPFARLALSGIVPVGRARDGSLTVGAAVDLVTWDEQAQAFAKRPELASRSRRLLVAGKVDRAAAQALAKAGWTVSDGLRR
jgi:hypothetical protein